MLNLIFVISELQILVGIANSYKALKRTLGLVYEAIKYYICN